MKIYDVYDVFTPSSVPTVTYVERQGLDLEAELRAALKTPGTIASLLSGPSKSGKTVLINTVIPSGVPLQFLGPQSEAPRCSGTAF